MTDAESAEVERRLAAARARLVLDRPFLGALVLRLPLKRAGRWCATTATDARAVYYNPRWIASLTLAQLQFALAHEALHCALGHFARRGHRERRRWDLACDYAINPLLLDEGLAPPPGAHVIEPFRGMSAEEIYPCIAEQQRDDETLDQHAWDGDDGRGGAGADPDSSGGAGAGEPRPAPLSAVERDRLRAQWQRHLASAAQRAREAGKLTGVLQRLIGEGLVPRVSWRAALAHYLVQTARVDYSWLRPSRREGDALLPSVRGAAGDLVVAIDTSGSIGDDDIAQFVAEIDALKGSLAVRATLLACDSALAPGCPWVAEPWESLAQPDRIPGGGGTDFRPVFEWVARHGLRPDALVYFTDAQGAFPARAPDYPVLWLVKGPAPVPWGRRVALD
jgi:predicted metal-dependent peptidase